MIRNLFKLLLVLIFVMACETEDSSQTNTTSDTNGGQTSHAGSDHAGEIAMSGATDRAMAVMISQHICVTVVLMKWLVVRRMVFGMKVAVVRFL
jgi:hypothetical protein